MASLQDSVTPYDGTDRNVSEVPYCGVCFKKRAEDESSPPLLRCSRCKILHYCSRECQKEDWNEHRTPCKRIQQFQQVVEREAAVLRHTNAHIIGPAPPENLFETHVGSFWGMFDTRDYMRARLRLADEIHDLAWEYETVQAWEQAIQHYQEMLRLCASDNLGLRGRFPFLLLNVNRDDDAFDFIRHWTKRLHGSYDNGDDDDDADADRHGNEEDDEQEEEDDNPVESIHRNSSEGDWIYPRNPDCRFLDLYEEMTGINTRYQELNTLVALAVIKMRLVAAWEAQKRTIQLFRATPQGARIHPSVGSVLTEMISGDGSLQAKMADQRRQLDRILDIIQENNPTVLPGLLNPGPLLSEPEPMSYTHGSPEEAYFAVAYAKRSWARIPGALALLQERLQRQNQN